jgi:hypothetical protein
LLILAGLCHHLLAADEWVADCRRKLVNS